MGKTMSDKKLIDIIKNMNPDLVKQSNSKNNNGGAKSSTVKKDSVKEAAMAVASNAARGRTKGLAPYNVKTGNIQQEENNKRKRELNKAVELSKKIMSQGKIEDAATQPIINTVKVPQGYIEQAEGIKEAKKISAETSKHLASPNGMNEADRERYLREQNSRIYKLYTDGKISKNKANDFMVNGYSADAFVNDAEGNQIPATSEAERYAIMFSDDELNQMLDGNKLRMINPNKLEYRGYNADDLKRPDKEKLLKENEINKEAIEIATKNRMESKRYNYEKVFDYDNFSENSKELVEKPLTGEHYIDTTPIDYMRNNLGMTEDNISADINRNKKKLMPYLEGYDIGLDTDHAAAVMDLIMMGKQQDDINYFLMTDQEKEIYRYYHNTSGRKKAEEYKESITRNLNARYVVLESAINKSRADLHPMWSTVKTVLKSPVTGIKGSADTIKSGLEEMITGETQPIDINSDAWEGVRERNDITATVGSKLNGWQNLLYQSGVSIGDMAMAMPTALIAPTAPAYVMASNAAASAAYDATQRGANAQTALSVGIMAAGIEYFTEKIGLENLFGMAGDIDGAVANAVRKGVSKGTAQKALSKSVVANILKQMAVEGGEEGISQVLNAIVDDMEMGENSNYSIAVKNYIANGYSEAEAKKLAFNDVYIKETAIAVAGGMISGGVFGGFGGATGAIRGFNRINQVDRMNKAYDSTVKNLQNFFESNAENGGNDTYYSINPEGHSPEMQKTIQEYNDAVDTGMLGFIENARKNKNDNKSIYELSDVSDRLATDIEAITGVSTAGFENVIKANAIRHIDEGHGINGSADSTMSDDSDIARMQYVIDNYDNIELLPEASKEFRDKNNSPAPMVRLSKRINGTYYIVEAVPDSNRHQLAVVTVYKNKAVEHQEVDASPLPNVQNDPNVTALSDNNITQKASVVNNQYMQGNEDNTSLQSNVDFLDRLKEKTGIDYEIMTENFKDADGNDDLSIEAMYDRSNNKIHFAKHVSSSTALKYIAAHEVTHFIEGTDEYKQYKAFVIKELFAGDTDAFNTAVQAKIDLYNRHGVTLDTNGAESEIVADFTKDFLYDENSINRLAQEKPNVFRRIYDFFVELIDKFRNGSDSQEISNLEQARDVFERAIKKADSAISTNVSVQNKINPNFYTEIDKWYNSDNKYNTSVFVGRTSKALQSIGVKDSYIQWDTSKIGTILNDHPDMHINIIKQVPNVLDKPMLIMESATQTGRLVAFGEVYDKNGVPVMVALELNPTTRKSLMIDAIKIASAYGKTGIQHLIDTSDIYYINPNKKRTDTWLTHNQLQLPLGQTKYGSIKKIPQNFYSVNNKSITESQNYSYAITDNSNVSPSGASTIALSEGAKRLNASGVVNNIDNSDGFMRFETVRTEDGKVLDTLDFDRHNFEEIKESEAYNSLMENLNSSKRSHYGLDTYRAFEKQLGSAGYKAFDEVFFKQFENGKKAYLYIQEYYANGLKNYVVDELGIKPGSKESKLVQMFGEKIIDESDLRRAAPGKADDIIKAEKWFRDAYDALIEMTNKSKGIIYPEVEQKVEAIRGKLNGINDMIDILSLITGDDIRDSKSFGFKPNSQEMKIVQKYGNGEIDRAGVMSYAKGNSKLADKIIEAGEFYKQSHNVILGVFNDSNGSLDIDMNTIIDASNEINPVKIAELCRMISKNAKLFNAQGATKLMRYLVSLQKASLRRYNTLHESGSLSDSDILHKINGEITEQIKEFNREEDIFATYDNAADNLTNELVNKFVNEMLTPKVQKVLEPFYKKEHTEAMAKKLAENAQRQIAELDEKIEAKKEEISSKKDKTTKTYAKLVNQLNNLQKRKADVQSYFDIKKNKNDKRLQMLSDMCASTDVNVFRLILEDLNKQKNKLESLLEDDTLFHGKRILKRNDYFHHFQEMSNSITGLVDMVKSSADISKNLAGISENTKPKSKWASFAQERQTEDTQIDAVEGFLSYLPQAAYATAVDPSLSFLRSLHSDIRSHITTDSQYESSNTSYEHLLNQIDEFANTLAGKTNRIDRAAQNLTGRKVFNVLNWFNKRLKINTVLGNVSSSVSQILNVPNIIGNYADSPDLLVKSAMFTLKNQVKNAPGIRNVFKDDSLNALYRKSTFLQERYQNTYNKFARGTGRITQFAGDVLGVLDEIGTKFGWYTAYEYARKNGYSDPIRYADNATRKLVGGRGIGEVSVAQSSKLINMVAPFTLEVTNAWNVYRDILSEDKASYDVSGSASGHLTSGVGRKMARILGIAIANWLFGMMIEKITGNDGGGFDPIGDIIEGIDESREFGYNTAETTGVIVKNILGDAVSNTAGGYSISSAMSEDQRKAFFGDKDPGRYGTEAPVIKLGKSVLTSGFNLLTGENTPADDYRAAIDYYNTLIESGESKASAFGGAALNVGKDFMSSDAGTVFSQLALPWGGNQLKKTTKGATDLYNEASYTKEGTLKYPVERTTANVARGLLFGSNSISEAKEYYDKDRKPLSADDTKTYQEYGVEDKKPFYDFVQNQNDDRALVDIWKEKVMKKTKPLDENDAGYYEYVLNLLKDDYNLSRDEKIEILEKLLRHAKSGHTIDEINDLNY